MGFKFSNKLTADDFKAHPVWRFTGQHEYLGSDGELVVEPVLDLPVQTLEGCFVGTELILANQRRVLGELHGIKLHNLRLTRLVLNFIVHLNNRSFLFRRLASKVSGPEQLSSFLDLPLSEIFPIRYDITEYAVGDPGVVRGEIQLEVLELLSRADLNKLILEEQKRKT